MDSEDDSKRKKGGDAAPPGRSFKNLIRTSGVSVVLQFTEVFFQFALLLVLTRGLGAEPFGHYIYAITIITFLVLPGKLGFDISAVRFISTYTVQERPELLRGYLRFTNQTVILASAGVTILFLAGLGFAYFRASFDVVAACLMAAPLVVLLSLLQVNGGILRGLGQPILSRIPQTFILPIVLLTGAALTALYYRSSPNPKGWPVSLAHTAAALVAVMVIWRWIRRATPAEVRDSTPQYRRREWLVSGGLLVLLAGLSKLQAQIDILMVGAIRNTTEAGVYTTASRIAGLPVLIMVATNMVISPLCASLLNKDKVPKGRLRQLIRNNGVTVIGLSLPLVAVLAVFGKPILSIFGEAFVAGYFPLLILLVGQFAFNLSGPSGVLLNMAGHEKVMAKVLAVSVAINIALNSVLIPLYGNEGAAISTAVSTIIARAILAICVWKKMRLPCTIIQPDAWRRSGPGDDED